MAKTRFLSDCPVVWLCAACLVVSGCEEGPETAEGRSGTAPPAAACLAAAEPEPADPGRLDLGRWHPDGAPGSEELESLTAAAALERLDQVRGFLASFRDLTRRARSKLSADDLQAVGNTSWEMQSLGFHNVPLTLEGTIRRQEYRTRQLEYELARWQHAAGCLGPEELEQRRSAYADAARAFQQFWDTSRRAD